MTQSQRRSVVFGALGVMLIFAIVCVVVLTSPTPAPKQYQIDFLAVSSAAREAAESAGREGLSTMAVEKAKTASGGLIQGMRLIQSGEVEVEANLAPRIASAPGQRTSVRIRFVRTSEVSGGIDWKCSGRPVSALPSFCSSL